MNADERIEFNKRFFESSDHTGRFMVKSAKTGYSYYVEPLDKGVKTKWGDLVNGQVQGDYGGTYKGAIHPSESLITEDNGFENITVLPAGMSPHGYITMVDDQRYEDMQAGKESVGLPGIKEE